ncbi:unnamed protein product [Calicophoron daubneyi]|uniref:BHLH domain-containing protein n=1 Tax=Calicophoron daubneyi TaxID=300641 RepID=A0AAV2TDD2_CALDB
MKPNENPTMYGGCIDTIYESDPDDENFSGAETPGIRERRRKLHTEAEQRRRNAIKSGFEGLLELVHPLKTNMNSPAIRMSKSTILHKSIAMIEKLAKQKHEKRKELEDLEKQVKALRILSSNYEKIAHENSTSINHSAEPISEDTKLQVFQMFADGLFSSFDAVITVAPFQELSGSVINWLEESCKPERLAYLMDSVLARTFPLAPKQNDGYLPSGTPGNMPYASVNTYPEPGEFSLQQNARMPFNNMVQPFWMRYNDASVRSAVPVMSGPTYSTVNSNVQLQTRVPYESALSKKPSPESTIDREYPPSFAINLTPAKPITTSVVPKPRVSPDRSLLTLPPSQISDACLQSTFGRTHSLTLNQAMATPGDESAVGANRISSDIIDSSFSALLPPDSNNGSAFAPVSPRRSFQPDPSDQSSLRTRYKQFF